MVKAAIAVEDFNDGVVDAVFESEEEVEVAEAHVGVNGDDGEAKAGEGKADVGGGSGFSNAAFAGGNDHDSWGFAGEFGFSVVLEERIDNGFL